MRHWREKISGTASGEKRARSAKYGRLRFSLAAHTEKMSTQEPASRARLDRLVGEYLSLRPQDVGVDRSRLDPSITDFTRTGWAYHAVKQLNVLALSINRALGEQRMPAMPEMVVLENTGFCNLRCPYCPTHGLDHKHAMFQSKEWTMADSLIAQIGHSSFAYARQISFSGAGENLLARNVEVAAELAHAYGCSIFINSNGTVVSKRRLRPLWGTTHMRLSIDGATPTIFEALRRGAKYQTVMRNIRTMIRAGELMPPSLRLQTAFNFGVCASNIREMPLMVDLAELLGVRTIVGFNIETERADLLDEPVTRYRARFGEYLKRMQERGRERGVRVVMISPPFQTKEGEPDLPLGNRLILPMLPESYYEKQPPLSELVDFEGLDEDAIDLAIDAVEAAIERMSGPLNRNAGEAHTKAQALHRELAQRLNKAYTELTPAEHTRLATLKDAVEPIKNCTYLHRYLYFLPDGMTRPCCFEFVPSVGQFGGRSVPDIFNGPELSTLVKRFHSDAPDPACAICPKWEMEPARDFFPFDPQRREKQEATQI